MNEQIIFFINRALQSLIEENYETAILYLNQANKIDKKNAEVHRLFGVISAKKKSYKEALDRFTTSLKYMPRNALTHSNIGNIFLETHDYEKAIECYRTAIKIDPKYIESYNNLANALQEQKKYSEALNLYEKAISLSPNYAEAYNNIGNLFSKTKFYDQALKGYKKAAEISSKIDYLDGNRLFTQMQMCDWSDFQDQKTVISEKVKRGMRAIEPLQLLAVTDEPELNLIAASVYCDYKYPGTSSFNSVTKAQQKIKLGYFSADFNTHPVSYLIAELFELHDRNSFEIYGFFIGKINDDDPLTQRLKKAFDHFIELDEMSDEDAARKTRELEIDIAIDLGGYTGNARAGIFANRAAPIQVSYLGYPSTMGANFIDYLVADTYVIPSSTRMYYSEKIVYMPGCFQINDRKRPKPDTKFTRSELGLPEKGIIFCCFNNSFKITPETFDLWMKIANKVPNSFFWLSENNSWSKENILREADRKNISRERIIFASRVEKYSDHISRHRVADLFLDTFPYNAHTTASDAIWAGLPLVTKEGKSFAARVAGSLLSALNMQDLIASDSEAYLALVVDIVTKNGKLSDLKQKLEANKHTTSLFDTPTFVKNLEKAYKTMIACNHTHTNKDDIYIN